MFPSTSKWILAVRLVNLVSSSFTSIRKLPHPPPRWSLPRSMCPLLRRECQDPTLAQDANSIYLCQGIPDAAPVTDTQSQCVIALSEEAPRESLESSPSPSSPKAVPTPLPSSHLGPSTY